MRTPLTTSAGVTTPQASADVPLRLVCISTDIQASAALQTTVATLLPTARVDAADTSIVRSTPDADCVILAVGRLYSMALSLVRELNFVSLYGFKYSPRPHTPALKLEDDVPEEEKQ